jgi:hypothetical protein
MSPVAVTPADRDSRASTRPDGRRAVCEVPHMG